MASNQDPDPHEMPRRDPARSAHDAQGNSPPRLIKGMAIAFAVVLMVGVLIWLAASMGSG